MQGVLLAAGKGTRLQPLTLARSKAMAPVAGRPLGARVADLLVAQGICELIVVVSPSDQEIQPYFTMNANLGVPVQFVVQEDRKGMAHALGLVADMLTGDFLMSACDNLVPVEHVAALVRQHRQSEAPATLSLMPIDVAQASKTGVVIWHDPFVQRIVEKPKPEEAPSNISSLPLYVFSPLVLDLLPYVQPSPRGEYELQDAIQMLIERTGRVRGVLTGVRRQVTTASDLLELTLHYLGETPQLIHSESPLPHDVRLVPPVVIEGEAVIGAGVALGPHLYVENGATIGAGAQLDHALVLRGAEVQPGSIISREVVATARAYAPASQ